MLTAVLIVAQQLPFTPYHANGIYELRERVGWTVAVAPSQPAAGTYTYTVKRDGLAVIVSGTLDLSSGHATIVTALDQPGMLLVEVRPPAGTPGFHGASKSEVGRVLLGAAVAPRQIRPSDGRPPDFDAFWAAELRRLDSIPLDTVLTPGESGRPGVEFFTIRMSNVGGAHVYGQLARPSGAAPGTLPALLILQWASPPYPLEREWVTEYAARGWLALDVEPHDVPADMPQAFYDALPQLIKNYRLIGRTSRDESYFLPMYLGDYRAAEYLASRADWNGKTLVVMGTSMGGQQGFAVAGLDTLGDAPLRGALRGVARRTRARRAQMSGSPFGLAGRVAVVTGGYGVLGSVIAAGLARAGAAVAILGRRRAAAEAKVQEIRAGGGDAIALVADVLDLAKVRSARDEVLETRGRVDILVNAAGGNVARARSDDRPVFDVPLDAFDEVLRLNLHGSLIPSLAFGEAMGHQGSGSIVNVSSVAARRVLSGVLGYSVAKAGIESVTRWLAVELARRYGDGLRVNAVAPGFFVPQPNLTVLLKPDR